MSGTVRKRRPGRPASVGEGKGATKALGLRLDGGLLARVRKWANAQPDKPGWSESIRRLVDSALKAAGY